MGTVHHMLLYIFAVDGSEGGIQSELMGAIMPECSPINICLTENRDR